MTWVRIILYSLTLLLNSWLLLATAVPEKSSSLPHGLKDLLPYDRSFSLWLLLVLLILFVSGLLYWYRIRRNRKQPIQEREDPLLTIRKAIVLLVPPDNFDRKAQEEYYYQLNIKFRHFIELKRNFPATDSTLQEIKEPLKKKLLLEEDTVVSIIQFFEKSEFIKFAERESTRTEAELDKQKVLTWIKLLENTQSEASLAEGRTVLQT